jgi:hypothetical protein
VVSTEIHARRRVSFLVWRNGLPKDPFPTPWRPVGPTDNRVSVSRQPACLRVEAPAQDGGWRTASRAMFSDAGQLSKLNGERRPDSWRGSGLPLSRRDRDSRPVRSITPALDDEGAWRAIKRGSRCRVGSRSHDRRSMVRVIRKMPANRLVLTHPRRALAALGAQWVPGDADAQAGCTYEKDKKTCKCRPFQERLKGFEPSTFCMASRRSSQLSYSRAGAEYSRGPGVPGSSARLL